MHERIALPTARSLGALLALLVCVGSRPAAAQQRPCCVARDSQAVLLYGDGWAFFLAPPNGWVLETATGDERIHAVIHRPGEDWANAPAAIYTTTFGKGPNATLASVIAGDSAETRQSSPGVRIERSPPIGTGLDHQAEVRITRGDRWGNVDAIAYVDQPHVVVAIVLTTRGEAVFQGAWPAFVAAVQSYLPVDTLRIEHGRAPGSSNPPR